MDETDFRLFPASTPLFLSKLRLLVDDIDTNDLIYWDVTGTSFHISDGNRLAKDVLPLFFKHNNLSSFIRQLNMYGFRKVNRFSAASAHSFKSDVDDLEFMHPYFIRNRQELMEKIRRKATTNYSPVNSRLFSNLCMSQFADSIQPPGQSVGPNCHQNLPAGSEYVHLSAAIRALRMGQDTLMQQFNVLHAENQELYREVSDLRDMCERQSQLIQTLFSFLSAFAKDRQGQNFRFTAKRKALAYSPSRIFPANSRSGLHLNLPTGYRLDNQTPPRSYVVSPHEEPPYKIPKMYKDANSLAQPDKPPLPPQVTVPSHNPNVAIKRYSRTNDPVSATFNQLERWKNDCSFDCHDPNMPPPLLAICDGLDAIDPGAALEASFKTSDNSNPEPTMTSLTRNAEMDKSALTRPTSLSPPRPPSVAASPTSADDPKMFDWCLSGCPTPVSLLQPDSIDICELMMNRRNGTENESEISIDDLFLATDPLNDEQQQHEVATNGDLPAESAPIKRGNGSGCSDTEMTSASNLIVDPTTPPSYSASLLDTPNRPMGNSSSYLESFHPSAPHDQKSSVPKTTTAATDSTTGPQSAEHQQPDLFGLPWEAQNEVVLDTTIDLDAKSVGAGSCGGGADEEAVATAMEISKLNAGLLPLHKPVNPRLKLPPVINEPSNPGGTSIIRQSGETTIPTVSIAPFQFSMAPPARVHLIQSPINLTATTTSSLVPNTATSILIQRHSSPLSTPIVTPIVPLTQPTTIQLIQPVRPAAAGSVVWSAAPVSSAPVRATLTSKKPLPIYRRIAPAMRPSGVAAANQRPRVPKGTR